MKEEIILVGGGGHCKSCIDVIESTNQYRIKGIIDLPSEKEKETLGYKVIGTDDDLPDLATKAYNFLITMGNLGSNRRREILYKIIKENGGKLPVIKSAYSIVSKYSFINEGTIIMHNTIINAGVKIGANSIINTKALIEHDAVVGSNCHISTNAVINGDCSIKNNVFIGSSTVLKQGVTICSNVIVGAGSVVIKDVTLEGVYAGNPSKKIRNV